MTLIDAELLELMPFSVTLKPITGRDQWGKLTYGTPLVSPALIAGRNQMVRTAEGEEVASSTTVYLGLNVDVKPESRVVLPDGTEREVITVNRDADELGWAVTTLYL